jgi:glycosyltransferase involved in cell wall biosynthesis
MKLSVVIPTYNRRQLLESCLDSLENQRFDKTSFEVIVINDGSSDSTEEFLSSFKIKTPLHFTFITQGNRGVSHARNTGIQRAQGKYIAFTDDDCILPDDWLNKIYEDIESAAQDIAGVGGPLTSVSVNKDSLIGRFIGFLDEFNYIPVTGEYLIRPVHISKLHGNEHIPYLRTSNAGFRRGCLKQIGGFDINFTRPGGEDPDLCYRLLNLNYKFYFDKNLRVLHQSRDSFTSYFRSLKNYLRGEIMKSCKKNIYQNKAIRMTYTFIPAQKIISALLSIFAYPVTSFRILKDGSYSPLHALIFPGIILSSKIYALFLSSYFYIKYLRCRRF